MPANVVKPGQEKYWEMAKQQAAKQGHAGDWDYVTGIFQKMVVNKSMSKAGYYSDVPPTHGGATMGARGGVWPGGVPSRERMEIMRLAQAKPRPQPSTMEQLQGDRPVLRISKVIDGVGLDVAQQQSYEKLLGEVLPSRNEVAVRQRIMSKMAHDRLDPVQRRVIMQRALSFRRNVMQKSGVIVHSLEEFHEAPEQESFVMKADPRGGKYHRRVPRKGGKGYRYYYDEDQYNRHDQAHVSGNDAAQEAIKSAVQKRLEGDDAGGLDIKDLKSLVTRYGSKMVGKVLEKERTEGRIKFQKGRLSLAKSERFVLSL